MTDSATWKDRVWAQGPFFTSIASVAIALMALFLTIYNGKLDREYKELSIRPFLNLDVETDDFHVGILNTGLGPAEIKLVALKFSPPKCLFFFNRPKRPTDEPTKSADKIYHDVLSPIDEYFADPLNQLVERSSVWEPPSYPKLYTRTLTPGEIISPKQEIILFQFQKEQMEIAQKKLQTLSADAYNNIMRRFFARAYAMPYYIDYCSLTGSYCVNQIAENCD